MAGFSVDLDLFAKMESQGIRDGLSLGTTFSNFANGLTSGIDAQQKWETQEQEQEIRANQIEQLPVANRIQEANADAADAKLAGIRNNPEQYAELAAQEQENELAAAQRQEQLQIQETNFMQVLQQGTSADKADAVLSGKYADLFAVKPSYYKAATDTVPTWEEADRKKYYTNEAAKRSMDLYANQEAQSAATYTKSEQTFFQDTEIGRLASELKITREQLLANGEVREGYYAPLAPKMEQVEITGKDGVKKKVNQPVMRGSDQIMEPITGAAPNDYKQQKVFYYNGEPYKYGLTDDTAKTFTGYQEPWKLKNKLLPGQGGETDYKKQADAVDTERALKAANDAKAQNATAAQQAQFEEQFFSGAKVTPGYQAGADRVKETVRANREEGAAKQNAPIRPNSVVVSRATDDEMFNSTMDYMTQRGGAPNPNAPQSAPSGQPATVKFQGVDTAEPGWAAKMREREEIQTAKASMALAKRKQQDSPSAVQQQASPQQQASQVTAPSDIPESFEVLTTNQAPSSEVVSRVLSRPELQNFSAFTKAVAAVESGGKTDAVSPTGVKGLMQVTNKTGQGILPGGDRTDPMTSAFMGATLLETELANFNNNPMLALVSYNAGPEVAKIAVQLAGTTSWPAVRAKIPEAVRRAGFPETKVGETLAYADKVISYVPKFIRTRKDMVIAQNLKDNGVLRF